MSKKLPEDIVRLRTISTKYKKQLKELTQRRDAEKLEYEMEIYYLQEKIKDFEFLCKKTNVDFTIVTARDTKRRGTHGKSKQSQSST